MFLLILTACFFVFLVIVVVFFAAAGGPRELKHHDGRRLKWMVSERFEFTHSSASLQNETEKKRERRFALFSFQSRADFRSDRSRHAFREGIGDPATQGSTAECSASG